MFASISRRPGGSVPAHVWGYDGGGALGIGTVARALRPVATRLPAATIDVQGGTNSPVALTSTGQVWTWGGNDHGQLGRGRDPLELTPPR